MSGYENAPLDLSSRLYITANSKTYSLMIIRIHQSGFCENKSVYDSNHHPIGPYSSRFHTATVIYFHQSSIAERPSKKQIMRFLI